MAQERRKVGSVSYQEAGEDYFGKRKLRRHAAFWSLWALGVAGSSRGTSTAGTWAGRWAGSAGC